MDHILLISIPLLMDAVNNAVTNASVQIPCETLPLILLAGAPGWDCWYSLALCLECLLSIKLF